VGGEDQEFALSEVFIDADACPVKKEVYRVAERHHVGVKVVANAPMSVPSVQWIELVVVSDGFDAADDWIVEHVRPRDIVVSDDIPLASRCLQKGARVVNARGREFTEAAIGDALATREVLSQLREHGLVSGGPAPFEQKDRSRFLDRFDAILRAALRQGREGSR
jgi:uncharacterized protein YaiI (UPF0178 family)